LGIDLSQTVMKHLFLSEVFISRCYRNVHYWQTTSYCYPL